jgi:putative membrane protein
MMHYWNDGYDAWWWMIPMIVVMLAVVGAVVWALVNAIRPDEPIAPKAPTAEEVLAQRLAAGEIDVAEYKARLDALRESVPPVRSLQ